MISLSQLLSATNKFKWNDNKCQKNIWSKLKITTKKVYWGTLIAVTEDPLFPLVFGSELYFLTIIVLPTQVDRLACDQGDYLLVLAALGGVMAFLIIVVIPHVLIYLFEFLEITQFIPFSSSNTLIYRIFQHAHYLNNSTPVCENRSSHYGGNSTVRFREQQQAANWGNTQTNQMQLGGSCYCSQTWETRNCKGELCWTYKSEKEISLYQPFFYS